MTDNKETDKKVSSSKDAKIKSSFYAPSYGLPATI